LGKVIKAAALATRPEALGREGERAVARVLEARAAADEIAGSARQQVIDLALSMAGKIVGELVELDPRLLDRIYERSLREAGPLLPVAIRVHPDDRERTGIDRVAGEQGVEVVDDPAVGRGGCRLEAQGVTVDATVEAALGALRAAIGEARG
jgi:flagellar biosynthesis/type III secretory pathway protein FliH